MDFGASWEAFDLPLGCRRQLFSATVPLLDLGWIFVGFRVSAGGPGGVKLCRGLWGESGQTPVFIDI